MSFVGRLLESLQLKNPIHIEHQHSQLDETCTRLYCQIKFEQIVGNQAEQHMFQSCSHLERNILHNHILLDWHFSTIDVFRFVNLESEKALETFESQGSQYSYFFSTFSISESVASSTGSGFMANPVTALGKNFLTAPDAFAELIRLCRPLTRLKKGEIILMSSLL